MQDFVNTLFLEFINTPFLGLVLYLIAIAAIAAFTYGKNKTKDDFILGGRKLGAWVIAFSERTAAESSWLILGLSGALFAIGLAEIWTVVGCVGGIILYWFTIAEKLRIDSEKVQAITLVEYFSATAGKLGPYIRIVSMLIITFFFSFYLAAQFRGAEKIIEVTFDFSSAWVMPAAAFIVVAYTMTGGFTAVCYTDVAQAILMLVTLVVMPVIGLVFILSNDMEILKAMESTSNTLSFTSGKSGWAGVAVIIGGLSWGLGYLGQPHLVTKFMAIDNPGSIKKSRIIAIIWTIFAYLGAAAIGVIGITLVHYEAIPSAGLAGADPERILPTLAGFLFPAWIAGILIAGAVAAMMSTADSQLLITASTIVEDFFCKALGYKISQKGLVLLSRIVTCLVGLLGFFLAVSSDKLIYDVVSIAWAGLGSSFGPALLLTLHWKKMNGAGILAGMITGSVSTALWIYIPGLDDLISVRFASFALSIFAVYLGTILYHHKK